MTDRIFLRRMELEPRVVESEGASLANLSSFLGLDDVSRLILDVGHSKTNLCLDIGWGKDGSSAVYFAVQEAF